MKEGKQVIHFRYGWKRWILLTVVLSLLVTGFIASCGGGGGVEAPTPPPPPETGTVVITGTIF